MFEWLFGGVNFDPAKDIPDLSGKVILVTGGNAGLGKETVRQLAKHNPKTIYLAARSPSKAESAISEIKQETPSAQIEYLELDLSSLSSVSKAATELLSRTSRLDILINNAGIMAVPFSLSADGVEIQLATNHLGHALLTKLLLPTLLATADAPGSDVRVVNLSSEAHNFALFTRGLVLDPVRAEKLNTNLRYGTSKMANLLHAKALRARYAGKGLTITSCHPGVIDTGLFQATRDAYKGSWLLGWLTGQMSRFFGTVQQGARNQLWCATGDRQVVGSWHYWKPVGKKAGLRFFTGEKEVEELWRWTEETLAKKGYE